MGALLSEDLTVQAAFFIACNIGICVIAAKTIYIALFLKNGCEPSPSPAAAITLTLLQLFLRLTHF